MYRFCELLLVLLQHKILLTRTALPRVLFSIRARILELIALLPQMRTQMTT